MNKKNTPAKESADRGDRSMAVDVSPGDRRIALVKKMRQLGATNASGAKTAKQLSEKVGYTQFDVYGLVSGTSGKAGSSPRCLIATGHVKPAAVEGEGIGYYLTAKGVKTDFSELPFTKSSPKPKAEKKPSKVEKKPAKAKTPSKAKAKPVEAASPSTESASE